MVAIRETLAETGIHCAIGAEQGRRVHPMTGVNARTSSATASLALSRTGTRSRT